MRNLLRKFSSWSNSSERLRIRNKDRLFFAKRLSLYLHAGISIVEAIDLIRDTPGSPQHTRLLCEISNEVQRGLPLSTALRSFERAYTTADIQLIAVGEASGTLPQTLSRLAELLELRASRSRAVLGALAYPTILFIGSLGLSSFLLIYAFPKIIPLFRGLHAELPFATRTLLGLSLFIQEYWISLITGFFVAIGAIHFGLRRSEVKRRVHQYLLRVPFFGKLFGSIILASLFRTIATLLSSGVRLDEALRMAREGISNIPYRVAVEDVRSAVLAGSKFSVSLRSNTTLFPPVSIQLVSAGEMTGTLSEATASTAHIFDDEVTERLQILSLALEPIIMIVMGLIIGFIALAIISPMYGITQSLSV